MNVVFHGMLLLKMVFIWSKFMRLNFEMSRVATVCIKNIVVILASLLYVAVLPTNVSAITPYEVMKNALDVYDKIDNYKADVQTYVAPSMDVSGSIFDSQEPIISFNLFFRKPNEHVVKQVRKSRHGIFRVELLSALQKLNDTELQLKSRESMNGKNCYVLECKSAEEDNTIIKLWICQRDWHVQQFSLIIKSFTLVNTQFKYPIGGNKRIRSLPIETRSFFPLDIIMI